MVLDAEELGASYEALVQGAPIQGDWGSTDPHLILYTSGTTGRPKGVMLFHTAIMWFALQQAALYPDMTADMVMLLTGPTFNTASINEQSIPTFLAGGTGHEPPQPGVDTGAPTSESIHLVGLHPRRHLPGADGAVPGRRHTVADRPRVDAVRPHWRRELPDPGAGCPVPAALEPHVRRDRLRVDRGRRDHLDPRTNGPLHAHPGSVGRSFGAETFRVVDRRAGRCPTARPARSAPRALDRRGYWNAAELTAAAVRDGWIKTGDLGRMDEDDYLFIEGRSRDLIISGGQNIYPAEIENALPSSPGSSSDRHRRAGPRSGARRSARVVVVKEGARSPSRTSSTSSRSGWPRTRSRATSCSWTRCPATRRARS